MFIDDGCSLFPNGTWVACCNSHDDAFSVGTSWAEFIEANWTLYTCIAQHNLFAAIIALIGVMTGGALFFWLGVKRPKRH